MSRLLALGPRVKPGALGIRATYADIAATVCQALGVPAQLAGESFLAVLGCAGEGRGDETAGRDSAPSCPPGTGERIRAVFAFLRRRGAPGR